LSLAERSSWTVSPDGRIAGSVGAAGLTALILSLFATNLQVTMEVSR
jgi:hypothetical protein